MVYAAKKFINNPNDVVTEFIEGLVETYPGLKYLEGFPEVKVVLRADVSAEKYDKVAVISGGGSGHEPAHAGYVGEGMLTAAICGDVFASPPVDSILAGIRAVTGPQGCLLIVKNYTGDRLNFGLAAEQAKSEGYKVETVIVGEDCALPPPRGIAGRRGLAGTVLIHKVAGAAAAAGLSLEKVAAEAKCASEMVGTMGVALSVCTLPGQVTSDRLGPEKMELGLGIHGEPGAAVVDVQPVDVVVSHVLEQILSPETNYVPITRGNRVVLMVNGLGGTPLMEIMIAAGKAVPKLQLEFGLAVDRVYTGLFMTSLDMAGFSISIMKADQSILNRLDAPTKAPNWPVGTDGNRPPAKIPVPIPPSRSTKSAESRPQELSQQGRILKAAAAVSIQAIDDESKDFYANTEVEFRGHHGEGFLEDVNEGYEEAAKIELHNEGVLADEEPNLYPKILDDTPDKITRCLHCEELLNKLPGKMVLKMVDHTTFLFKVLHYRFCLTVPEGYPRDGATIKCLSALEDPIVDEEGYVILEEGLTLLSAVREVFVTFTSLDSPDKSEKDKDLFN